MHPSPKYKRSRQRERILRILRSTVNHPTADRIYNELKQEFPSLSMGTVYRNLDILVKQNLVKKLESGSNFARFDANVSPHSHFICRECGAVIDLPLKDLSHLEKEVEKTTAHEVDEHRVYFYGRCRRCAG